MQQQLTMFRGNTMAFDFSITLGGNPVDLTGAGLWFTAKTSPSATAVVFQKSIQHGITLTSARQGAGVISLDPTDTDTLPSRQIQLYFDMELELAGVIHTIAYGRLIVKSDITVR